MDPSHPIPVWYLQAQIIICAFGSISLLALWRPSDRSKRRVVATDQAFLWFAGAVAIWAVMSGVILALERAGKFADDQVFFVRLLGSPPNSALFLFSIRHFDYAPELFKSFRSDRVWLLVVAGVVALDVALMVLLRGLGLPREIYGRPDVVLSFLTLLVVGWVFYRSFRARGFRLLSLAAMGAIALVILAQVPEAGEQLSAKVLPGTWRWTVPLSSKAALIAMFMALAFTWALDRANKIAEESDLRPVTLRFLGAPSGNPKRPHVVELQVGDSPPSKRALSDTRAKLLLALAVAKKLKGDAGALRVVEDLQTDATGLRRIGEQLEYGWELLHDMPDSGLYRLTVPADRIIIEPTVAEKDGDFRRIMQPLIEEARVASSTN